MAKNSPCDPSDSAAHDAATSAHFRAGTRTFPLAAEAAKDWAWHAARAAACSAAAGDPTVTAAWLTGLDLTVPGHQGAYAAQKAAADAAAPAARAAFARAWCAAAALAAQLAADEARCTGRPTLTVAIVSEITPTCPRPPPGENAS